VRRLILLLLVVLAGVYVGRDARSQLQAPVNLAEARILDVPKGSSMSALLRSLEQEGVLGARQRSYLSLYARLTGQARNLKAGEYELTSGMTATDLTALLASGHVVLHRLQLIEGWRFQDALAAVRSEPALAHTLPADDGAALMAALGAPGRHPEGLFYPDTYNFPRGTSDVEFLRRAYTTMERVLGEEWAAREEGLPYASPAEALTMASIVERETGMVEERPEIAGVFVRRLRARMRLQTDPSVIYGLGAAFDGNLRKRDLLADTPYNTYTRGGLPPTPICLPGRAALRAALHPAPGKTLYFVARGDGSHQFSETMTQHQAAVRKFQLRRRK